MTQKEHAIYTQSSFNENRAAFILSIIYAVGIIGIKLPLHESFILLTPLNLIISAGLVAFFDKNSSKDFWTFFTTAFIAGYLIEVLGVQTGVIFGNYSYGAVLGPKLFGTPIAMGINWFILIYGAGNLMTYFFPKGKRMIKSLIGATSLIMLDFLIEPVAMAYDFWSWENDVIPIQNYIAWWMISLILLLIFYKFLSENVNKVAIALLALQLIFFGILNI